MHNVLYLSGPVHAGLMEFCCRYTCTNTRRTSEKMEVPFTSYACTMRAVYCFCDQKVGLNFLQMVAYPHLHSPTLSVTLISILYGPGGKKFSSSFFPHSFPFQYHVHFSPHTVNPHSFLCIILKVKLHAVNAYDGVKE